MKFSALFLFLLPALCFSEWSQTISGKVNSVHFDIETTQIFAATEAGAIVKVSEKGSEPWVNGLEDPRGMHSSFGTLWVAAKGGVVGINLKSGRITAHHEIKSEQLTDVAVDRSGAVYTADAAGHVWKNSDSFLHFKDEAPSAVLVVLDSLYVLTNRALREVSLKDKSEKVIFRWKRSVSGGLALASSGDFLLGDIERSAVQAVARNGKIAGSKAIPGLSGNFSYQYFRERSQDLLLLPIREKNQVTAVSAKF